MYIKFVVDTRACSSRAYRTFKRGDGFFYVASEIFTSLIASYDDCEECVWPELWKRHQEGFKLNAKRKRAKNKEPTIITSIRDTGVMKSWIQLND